MEKCKKLLKKISLIDVFGVNLSFTFLKKEKFGSIIGAICTLFVYTLLLYKLILSIMNLINKEDLEVQYQDFPVNDDILGLKDFEVALCPPYKFLTNNSAFDDAYSYSYSLETDIPDPNMARIPLKSEDCKRSMKVDGNELVAKNFCKCLHFDDEKYVNITKNSTMFQDVFLAIHFEADLSRFDAVVNPFEKLALYTAGIIFPKKYVNSTDYYELIQMDTMVLRETFIPGIETMVTLEADKLQVDVINDIYTFGLVDPEVTSNFTYSLKVTERKNVILNGNEKSSMVTVYFKHSGMQQLYSIYSFNLESFLALFGGYFQVFFVFFNIISSFANNHTLEKKIERRFKKRIDRVNMIINELSKMNFTRGEENHFKNSISNDNREINTPNQDIIYIHKLDRKENKENEFLSNSIEHIEIISPHSVGFPPGSEQNSLTHNHKDNQPQQIELEITNRVHNPIRTLKRQQQVVDSEEFYKELIQDFHDQLDYDTFYKLVKEIKLIKFFLFDSVTLLWLNKLQDLPFCIEKFDKFILLQNDDSNLEFPEGNLKVDDVSDEIKSKLNSFREFLVKVNFNN